jgi:putative DNA primase/helicase
MMIEQTTPSNVAITPEPQNPTNSLAKECHFCHRTKGYDCTCDPALTPEEVSESAAQVRAYQEKHKPERDAHKARMAELQAEIEEAESVYIPEDFRQIICALCGKSDLQGKDDYTCGDLCMACYAGEYRRTHKEPKVLCKGDCGLRWPKQLLDEHGLCEACAEPTEPAAKNSEIIYQAMAGPKGEETHKFSIMGHLASTVTPMPIRWIWEQRFPAGKLALLNGPQGSGKSMLFIDIIAHVTTGKDWPDGAKNTLGPRKVLLASTEDDENDTIIPRLMAAGADLNNVTILDKIKIEEILRNKGGNVMGRGKVKLSLLDFRNHTKLIKGLLKKYPDTALILLDPITAFLGVDETKDKETRPVLESIADAISGTLCTVIGIIHSNKMTKGSAGDKVKGGSSMLGVTRTAWAVGRDPEDKNQRYMALIKGNVLKRETGLRFTIENKVVDAAQGIEAGYVVWGEEIDEDANDMLAASREINKEGGMDKKGEIFKALVQTALADGPQPSEKAIYPLGEQRGISERTMKSALKDLGVHHNKRGPWFMSLPPNCGPSCKECGISQPEDPKVSDPAEL